MGTNLQDIEAKVAAADEEQVDKVEVSVIPILSALQQKEKRENLEVLVRVQAPTMAAADAPIDLVAVLDVSGSMRPQKDSNGKEVEPSRLGSLKEAMKFIIGKLRPGDQLATVAFNHDVVKATGLTAMSGDGKSAGLKLVDELNALGYTSFAPALDRAVEILENRPKENARAGFIVFLSDGSEDLPKEGTDDYKRFTPPKNYPSANIWDSREAYQQLRGRLEKYPVHAFGLSEGHDPKSMRGIAKLSGGTYSFVNEDLAKIKDAFALCLGGFHSVVARDVDISLAVKDSKVRLTRIDAGVYKGVVPDDKSGNIRIPVLYAGERKDFIVHLQVPAATEPGTQKLLAVSGTIGEFVLGIERPQAADPEAKPHQEVAKQLLRFAVLQMLDKLIQGFVCKPNAKDQEKALALQQLAASLLAEWKKLTEESITSTWNATDAQVRKSLDDDVKKMAAALGEYAGLALMCSWDSSHRSQRATTMGSPDNVVREFKTPGMEHMAQEAKKRQPAKTVPVQDAPEDQVTVGVLLPILAVKEETKDLEATPTATAAKEEAKIAASENVPAVAATATPTATAAKEEAKITASENVPAVAATATPTATAAEEEAKIVASENAPAVAATATAAEEEVTVSVFPPQGLDVLVRVRAPTKATGRAPIDLVAVLDVSVSMGWGLDSDKPAKDGRSRLAMLKEAMKFVIDKLEDCDRLAAVAFSNKIVSEHSPLRAMSGDGRSSAQTYVDGLNKVYSGTAFAPGLDRAVKILESRSDDDKEKRVGFIVFLSDGVENHPADWDRSGAYTVHTFGFSKSHDPAALVTIADHSGGTYSCLNEGLDRITDAFALCLGGLQMVVARDVAVTVRVSVPGHQVVRIAGIDSGAYRNSVAADKRSGEIKIPVLYAGEVKDFIVHLSTPTAAPLSAGGTWDSAGRTALQITPVAAGQPADGEVARRVFLFTLLEKLAEFHKENPAGSKAADSLLLARWAELKKSPVWSAVADGVRKSLEGDVEEMVAKLRIGQPEGVRKGFLLSWWSSNRTQRATTMGEPGKVIAEFVTPGMDKMAEEAKKTQEEQAKPQVAAPTPPAKQQVPAPLPPAKPQVPAPTPPAKPQVAAPPPAKPQAVTIPASNKVTVTAQAAATEIPADEGRNDVAVLVTVVAPARKERAPIDLVALLDVSGSMAWKAQNPRWTRLELVKGAMQLAMRKLGAADRLAIVPFNQDVAGPTALTPMDHAGQSAALDKLLRLAAGGDTRFMPALNHAKRLLDGRPEGERRSRPGFVFLLSDGDDHAGVLRKNVDVGYPVHTFGMCQKSSPRAMLHIASQSGGSYHAVDDDLKNVALALGGFVGGITSVVAVNARVHLAVPAGSGARITNIDSGSYAASWSGGTGADIDVGVLYANDTKRFVVHLSVPALEHGHGEEEQTLVTVSGGYGKPGDGRKTETMDYEQAVKVRRPSTKQPAVEQVEAEEVAAQVVLIHVAAVVRAVVESDTDQDLLADELEKRWESFKAAEKHVDKHLTGGDEVVAKLSALLREEEGGSVGVMYAHSWLASQATQQATTFAVSSTVEQWFGLDYMARAAEDLAADASSISVRHSGEEECTCVELERMEQRLEVWSRVKRELPELYQPSEDAHLTAVIREASLDAINRAMHHDMYLAFVHASNLRRCYMAGKPKDDVPARKDH